MKAHPTVPLNTCIGGQAIELGMTFSDQNPATHFELFARCLASHSRSLSIYPE